MTLHAVQTRETSYLLVDETGRQVGEVLDSRYPLEQQPPQDTVFLVRPGRKVRIARTGS